MLDDSEIKTLDTNKNGKLLKKLSSELDNKKQNDDVLIECVEKALGNYLDQFKDVLGPLHEKLVLRLYDNSQPANPKVQEIIDNIENTLKLISKTGYKDN